ncbi:hypothetical protein JRQ81_018984, partial [Phrynocephalus forsythii]
TSNYLCAMEASTRCVMQKFLPFLEALPDDQKTKSLSYHAEVMSLIDYETIAAHHFADAVAKQIAIAVYLLRHAWLCTATITDDARNWIEDSPFDGEVLLPPTTDESLGNILKMRKTARSYSYQGTSG